MILDKNMEVLNEVNPGLAALLREPHSFKALHLQTSRTGRPCVRVSQTTLHSLYDPVKEAEAWAEHYREKVEEASSVAVLGFGFGYHIQELCRLELCRVSGMDIVVFEPRLDVIRMAFESLDLTDIIPRVRIVTDENIPTMKKGFEVLEHKPSINVSRHYFSLVSERLRRLRHVKNGQKVLVVGPIYGGSLSVTRYCVDALKKMGHDVDFMDNSIYHDAFFSINDVTGEKAHRDQLRVMFINFLSELTIARSVEFQPDLVLALAQAPLTESSLIKLRENRVPTAFWFVEDFRLMEYWKGVAPLYDFFFTIQRGEFFDRLTEKGARNYSYLPLAASPDIHKKVQLSNEEGKEFGSDVSFVGAGYYNRRFFFSGLLDFDLKIWGSEWNVSPPLLDHVQRSGAWIETEDAVKIFNASRVNVNLHSSTYHEGVNPYGDFVNPRVFEIASCGSFQLVDFRSEMPELFNIGEEIICFNDLDDIREKIRYYLDNPEKMAAVADRGRERVLREHTYEHRMEEMFGFMIERGYEPAVWNNGKEDVEALIEGAGRDTEVGMYLSRFRDKGRIDLNDIDAEIKSGDGDFTETEKIFVLMKELCKQFAPK